MNRGDRNHQVFHLPMCLVVVSAIALGGARGQPRRTAEEEDDVATPAEEMIARAKDFVRSIGHDPGCFTARVEKQAPFDEGWTELKADIPNVLLLPTDACPGEYPLRVFEHGTVKAEWDLFLRALTTFQNDLLKHAHAEARKIWTEIPEFDATTFIVTEAAGEYIVQFGRRTGEYTNTLSLGGGHEVVLGKKDLRVLRVWPAPAG